MKVIPLLDVSYLTGRSGRHYSSGSKQWRMKTVLRSLKTAKSANQNYNGIQSLWELVLVCVGVTVKRRMYKREVGVDVLSAVKSLLADVSSVSPSSKQRENYDDDKNKASPFCG